MAKGTSTAVLTAQAYIDSVEQETRERGRLTCPPIECAFSGEGEPTVYDFLKRPMDVESGCTSLKFARIEGTASEVKAV